MKRLFLPFVLALPFWLGCESSEQCPTLPILGDREVIGGDTIFHTIPPFSFMDQDSIVVNNETLSGKAYVADFFFISCPTICPKVKKQMLRVYETFLQEPGLILLSHTIDIRHDTIPRLKRFSADLGVDGRKWHFVTGDEDSIYAIADDYFSVAIKDDSAPGGFDHSGRLILVDGRGRVRSFCDGTDPASVDQFMDDIRCLLLEK